MRNGRRIAALLMVVLGGMTAIDKNPARAEVRPLVHVLRLEKEAITPVTARYLGREIREAGTQRAECLVIVLDTPGGLVDSTSDVVKEILNSRIPVVVYVAPRGARAASGGGFMLLSAHIAAMAPTTRVGAMHPVRIGGLPTIPEQKDTPSDQNSQNEKAKGTRRREVTPSEEKIVNDTVAWARGLAELRGRNVTWAESAVRESIVATEQEALDAGIIDLVVDDLEDLLKKLDGRQVSVRDRTVTFQTANAEIRTVEMWWGERFLATISNPNVAFLLLIFGFYGVLFELYTPGWGVAGTLGIVLLLLAFFGLAVLPINYIGLVLIAIAFGMFVAEVFVTSYGALAVGGVVCLVIGGMMLVESPGGFLRVSLWVVVPVAVATAAITTFLVGSIVSAHRKKVVTGSEGLLGTTATAIEDFLPVAGHYEGTIRVHGELWKAVCPAPVGTGQKVAITNRDGLTLSVHSLPEPGHENVSENTT